MDDLTLLPHPRSLKTVPGHCLLEPHGRIVMEAETPHALLFAARRLQRALAEHAALSWELSASALGHADAPGVVLRVGVETITHKQGYSLAITPEGILVEARTVTGLFYGTCTLVQIIRQRGRTLPAMQITDWPDFPARGVMLDISRDKVPRMETLFELVEMLAGWKVNQLQLYTEHTFAYRQHPEVWASASPMTGDDILALDAFCRERHIELVPNQNSFGHMQRWLTHERYAPLAEIHGEFQTPWGAERGPYSLSPVDPGSLELIRGLYDELLPHFSSRQFNVGCDETFDLGQGRSREACEQRGTHRVYLEYLLKLHAEVERHQRTMQFWGDILIEHPELMAELPKDIVALEWGYEADHPFDEHAAHFAALGLPFYVCPGTSSWNTIGGRTDNAIRNLLNAAEAGLKHGAEGYLITDWGDNGHWQVLPISYLGFAVGAAYSWALDANRDMEVAAVVSQHAFGDETGSMGRVLYDLGNVYHATAVPLHNSSPLFWTLQRSFTQLRARSWEEPDFPAALAAIDEAMQPFGFTRLRHPNAVLLVEEVELAARMMRHACRRGQMLLAQEEGNPATTSRALEDDIREIIREYERIWLARNRPGGLADSVARLKVAQTDYQQG